VDRETFLARIRERLAEVEPTPLPSGLPRTFASGDGRAFERFADELAAVGGEARRVHAYELADAVADLAGGCATAVVAPGVGPLLARIEEGLHRAGCEVVPPGREESAGADLGITGAEAAVASTGSVLVPMGPDAPRVASLLPARHVVVIPEERMLPGFEELFEVLPGIAAERAQTVLITGPSRTGDIELSLVRGVHGPMHVTVLVVAP
jgi:L-lactate dehydrogenase complex protein LldG